MHMIYMNHVGGDGKQSYQLSRSVSPTKLHKSHVKAKVSGKTIPYCSGNLGPIRLFVF